MTSEEQNTLRIFETRVRQLILEYKSLEEENRGLRASMNEKDLALNEANEKNRQLQEAYTALKLAKMMEIGNDDIKETRQRVSKLIKEVDKCIALLNI